MKRITKLILIPACILLTFSIASAASLISADPNIADPGQSVAVEITAQDTHFDQATSVSIWLSKEDTTISAYGYYSINETKLVAWFDFPTQIPTPNMDLNITTDIDGTMTLPDAFIFNTPQIVSIHPDNAQPGGFVTVTISGKGTHFTQASPLVIEFAQATATISYNWWAPNDNLMVATVYLPDYTDPVTYDFEVTNQIDGKMILYNGFTVNPVNPELDSVTPDTARPGQRLAVHISGTKTFFSTGSISVRPPKASVTAISWLEKQNLRIFSDNCYIIKSFDETVTSEWYLINRGLLVSTFDIPQDAPTGLWNLCVAHPIDGVLRLENAFTIAQPGDLTSDGAVNFTDFAIMGDNWLKGTEQSP